MTVKRLPFIVAYFGVISFCLSCAVRPGDSPRQPPASEKQVDVISAPKDLVPPLEPSPFYVPETITVDVREVAQNLDNGEMFEDALRVLRRAENASFSTATVNLLIEHLYHGSSDRTRGNAMVLLGYSSHPDAIPILIDQLHNNPSVHLRSGAAIFLGKLAGEAAVPELKRALAEDGKRHNNHGQQDIVEGVQTGFGYAGGTAVPVLIKTFEKSVDERGGRGGALWLVGNLGDTLDRRVIPPLIKILSLPTPPSDPMMDTVRDEAASVLFAFAFKPNYKWMLKRRINGFAEGIPVTPRPNRRVGKSDRTSIRHALEAAGYDTFGITDTYPRFKRENRQ